MIHAPLTTTIPHTRPARRLFVFFDRVHGTREICFLFFTIINGFRISTVPRTLGAPPQTSVFPSSSTCFCSTRRRRHTFESAYYGRIWRVNRLNRFSSADVEISRRFVVGYARTDGPSRNPPRMRARSAGCLFEARVPLGAFFERAPRPCGYRLRSANG